MKRLTEKQTIVMAVTLLIAAVAPSPSYADKPNTPVEVMNTAANPVPVIQLGTTTVNLSSSNNTVVVANPTNNPVLVRQVDSGAAQPVQFLADVRMDIGADGGTSILYTVPSGKRLVVEYVSVSCSPLAGEALISSHLFFTRQGSLRGLLEVIPQFTGNNTLGRPLFKGSQLVKGYGEAGDILTASVERSARGGIGIGAFVTATGYLVDVP